MIMPAATGANASAYLEGLMPTLQRFKLNRWLGPEKTIKVNHILFPDSGRKWEAAGFVLIARVCLWSGSMTPAIAASSLVLPA